jgi:hypothetical protein
VVQTFCVRNIPDTIGFVRDLGGSTTTMTTTFIFVLNVDQAWISRNKLKSKLRHKSEILLKFEKSQKNAFLEKKT